MLLIDFCDLNFVWFTGSLKTREQINELSAFIDANIIYGNSAEQVLALREQSGNPSD